jgi:hypothetical protein
LAARAWASGGSSSGGESGGGLNERQQARRLGRRQGRRPSHLVVSSARGANAPAAFASESFSTVWTELHVHCLYVRRELRTLTDDDRNAFFDAAEVLFRTPTAAGQALYGAKFYGLGTFAMDHNVLAGNSDCDHMHDGLGFLTNHGAHTVTVARVQRAAQRA